MAAKNFPSRSGRLNVRLPPELHDALADEAERQDRSLNNLIVRLLSSGVGWKARPAKRGSTQQDSPSARSPAARPRRPR